jgi:DNA polymerase III epsilon subunit-like protein
VAQTKYVHSAPIHLNGNLFCAVDTETTGLDPEKNSIIELCILPLKADYSINKSIIPFNMQMQPIPGKIVDREAMQINKISLTKLLTTCLDAYKVADMLVEWFEKLGLPQYKRIVPIAQNWPFDRAFLISWLGVKTYELLFDRHYRDTMTLALSMNDISDMRCEKIPFPKVNLSFLAKRFGVENPDPHRALGDCVTTAQVYKHLLKYYDVGSNPPSPATDGELASSSTDQS